MIKEGKAYQYAKWCVKENERMVPKYVKIQAQKWIDIADGKDDMPPVEDYGASRLTV